MDIIRGMGQLKAQHHGCVLTIGNFDGVHLGHQAILGQLAQKSGELSLPLTVMTFEPYPLEYFNQAACPARLTRFREKAQALLRYSVDRLLCLKFNQDLAAMSAETFIETLLVKALGVKYLVVGDDFHFGHKRLGDFALLKQAGQKFGFKVVNMRSFTVDGQRVSSTLIRRALAFGKLSEAEKFLGRPYRMSGRVVYGDGLGQQLGFPTANILLHRHNSPVKGIYTVEVLA